MLSIKRISFALAVYLISSSIVLAQQVDSSLQFFETTKAFVDQTPKYYTPLRIQASSADYIHFKDAVLTENYYRNPAALKCWALKKEGEVYLNLGYRPLHTTFGFFARTAVSGRYNIIVVGPRSPEIMEYSTTRKSSATIINPGNRGYIDPNSNLNWLDENNISYIILIADALTLSSGTEQGVPIDVLNESYLKLLMRDSPELQARYSGKDIKLEDVLRIINHINQKYNGYFNR